MISVLKKPQQGKSENISSRIKMKEELWMEVHNIVQEVVNKTISKNKKCMKKIWYIYTVRYYSAIRKSEIMQFAATWMDLEIIILSEVSQIEKDKYHMISLICVIYKKIQMNLFTKQKQTHRLRRQS